MIKKEKKLFFNAFYVWLVDEKLSDMINKKKYSYIYIYSYKKLNLDKSFRLKQKKIVNIYLKDPLEQILKKFKRATRQEINKTYNIKELTFVMDDKNLEETYKLYKKFEYNQNRVPWKIETFSNVKLFNAYYKGKLISAIPCYDLFPYLQARAMSSDRYQDNDKEMRKIVGHATRRLIYEICRYTKERNYKFFGLGSINYNTEQKSNVSQFKNFFGGIIEDEYSYVYKSRIFKIFEDLVFIKVFLKKVFRL